VRSWGCVGTNARGLVEQFVGEIEAGQALVTVAQAKRQRGYRDSKITYTGTPARSVE
jgi:predicted DNA-binding WGR domain protein